MRKQRPQGKRDSGNGLFLPISSRARTVPGSQYCPAATGSSGFQDAPFTPCSARLWEGIPWDALTDVLVVGTQQSPVTGREKTVMPGDAAGPEKRAGEALRAQRCLWEAWMPFPAALAEAASVCRVPGPILLWTKHSSGLQKKPFHLENIPCSPYRRRPVWWITGWTLALQKSNSESPFPTLFEHLWCPRPHPWMFHQFHFRWHLILNTQCVFCRS